MVEITQLNVQLALVGDFHTHVGIPEPLVPCVPSRPVYMRHVGLIGEEFSELARAMAQGDQLDTLDALVDLQYITHGISRVCGFTTAESMGYEVPAEFSDPYRLIYYLQRDVLGLTEAFLNGKVESVRHALWLINVGIRLTSTMCGYRPIWHAAFEEVHNSNMTKERLGDERSGKIIKGAKFVPPDLQPLLDKIDELLEPLWKEQV